MKTSPEKPRFVEYEFLLKASRVSWEDAEVLEDNFGSRLLKEVRVKEEDDTIFIHGNGIEKFGSVSLDSNNFEKLSKNYFDGNLSRFSTVCFLGKADNTQTSGTRTSTAVCYGGSERPQCNLSTHTGEKPYSCSQCEKKLQLKEVCTSTYSSSLMPSCSPATMDKSHLNVLNAGQSSQRSIIWFATWERIQEKDHTNVRPVEKASSKRTIWQFTFVFIVEKDHMLVLSTTVTKSTQEAVIWKFMLEFTPVRKRNLSHVLYVEKLSHDQVIVRNIFNTVL